MNVCRALLLSTVVVVLGGCATLQEVSSGQVGCSPREIAISNDRPGFGTRTWTAKCRGEEYACSAHGGGQYSTPQVSCAPKRGKAVAGPQGGGCTYDAQCKGDRICVKGACVDPGSESTVVPASGSQQL